MQCADQSFTCDCGLKNIELHAMKMRTWCCSCSWSCGKCHSWLKLVISQHGVSSAAAFPHLAPSSSSRASPVLPDAHGARLACLSALPGASSKPISKFGHGFHLLWIWKSSLDTNATNSGRNGPSVVKMGVVMGLCKPGFSFQPLHIQYVS